MLPAVLQRFERHTVGLGRRSPSNSTNATGPDDGGADGQQDAAVEEYDEFDPWAPLDMHAPGTLLVRPFRMVSGDMSVLTTTTSASRHTPCTVS